MAEETEKKDLGLQRKREFGELRGRAMYDKGARRELGKREREAEGAEKIELKKARPGYDPDYFKRVEERRKRLGEERRGREQFIKKGGWFQKIPTEILLSPGGMILIFLAGLIEIVDWIPLPVVDQLWELPLEIIFIVFFVIITKAPFKSLIIPFIIERIPLISDILPTWLIRFFV